MLHRTLPALLLASIPLAALADETPPAPATALTLGNRPLEVTIVEPPEPSFSNRISLSPLSALFGVGSLTYERAITPSFAASISPTFLYLGFDEDRLYGAGAGLGLAFYPSGEGLRGLRIGADFAPGFIGVSSGSRSSDTVFVFQGKASVGYVWAWRSGFSLGLGGGVQYLHVKPTDGDTGFDGVLPSLDATVGFSF